MLQSTGALLSETWSFLLVRWKSVGIGLIAFTMLLAVNQAFFARQLDANIAGILSRTGLTSEQFETQLVDLLQTGAPADEVDRILEALRQSMASGVSAEQYGFTPTASNAGLYFVISSMPLVFALMLIAAAILAVSAVFFMLLSVQDGRGPEDAARQLPGKIVAMSLLLPWIFFRSFAWLPILVILLVAFALPPVAFLPTCFFGLLVAVALTSRYVIAPVLLLGGQSGVLKSASISRTKTKGFILAILGSRITLALFLIIVIWLASGLVQVLSSVVPKAGFLVWLLTLEVSVAFAAVFHVRLARALMLKNRA